MKRLMTMTLPDGSVWGVPTEMIARHRAAEYADEFDNDVERSLAEDTLPLFESSTYDIKDWAINNMNWRDFNGHHVKVKDADPRTAEGFEAAWLNSEKGFSD